MGSAATGFVKNNKKVTWKEFARMLAVLAVPIAMQNLLATTASMVGNEQGIWSGDHMCGNIWNSICGGDCGCTGVDTWNIYR